MTDKSGWTVSRMKKICAEFDLTPQYKVYRLGDVIWWGVFMFGLGLVVGGFLI